MVMMSSYHTWYTYIDSREHVDDFEEVPWRKNISSIDYIEIRLENKKEIKIGLINSKCSYILGEEVKLCKN